jgi:hypothetical protein
LYPGRGRLAGDQQGAEFPEVVHGRRALVDQAEVRLLLALQVGQRVVLEGVACHGLLAGARQAGAVQIAQVIAVIERDVVNANVAAYSYMGTGRRVSTSFANGIAQTFAGGAGYTGLDRYGRIIDLNYSKNNGTVYRYQPLTRRVPRRGTGREATGRYPRRVKGQYGYDQMGNP